MKRYAESLSKQLIKLVQTARRPMARGRGQTPWIMPMMRHWRALNALLLGDRETYHLGFNLRRLRWRLITLVALTAGPTVAVTGGIGFVGLVMPHLVRLWLGADHRWVLPASCLGGAMALTLADWIARVAMPPMELPIGLVTSLIGGPFFVWLLIQGKYARPPKYQ